MQWEYHNTQHRTPEQHTTHNTSTTHNTTTHNRLTVQCAVGSHHQQNPPLSTHCLEKMTAGKEKEVSQAWREELLGELHIKRPLCYLVNYSLLLAAILCYAAVVSLPLSVSTCCSLCLPHTQKSVLFFQIFFVSLSVLLHQHPPC